MSDLLERAKELNEKFTLPMSVVIDLRQHTQKLCNESRTLIPELIVEVENERARSAKLLEALKKANEVIKQNAIAVRHTIIDIEIEIKSFESSVKE